MERRPSTNTGMKTTTMPNRRRQWRDETIPTKHTVKSVPRPPDTSMIMPEIPRPSVPVVAPCPVVPVNNPTIDIQSLLSGQLSSETQRAYRGDLKHFLTFIQCPEVLDNMELLPTALAKVDRQTATAYRDFMMTVEKRSASTVNRRLATVNVVFNALCEESIISKNPFSWVKRPKLSNIGTTPAFTQKQAEVIISQPDINTVIGRRDRIILLLLFFCGLRRSEVTKIESGDFFQNQGHVLLKIHGKGRSDKTDTVLVPDSIWPEIQSYIKDKDGLLFTAQSRNTRYNRTDRPLSANRVYLLFKEYCQLAGIDADAYSPHSTRATFITLCLSGGADVRSVMYASRHADPSVTIRYDRQRLDMKNHASKHLHIDLSGGGESSKI
jgi:integrase/recombinase XerD